VGIRFRSIPVENISSFFVEERNTFITTNDGKNYDLDFSLDQLQKMVDPNLFFRINRNYLVNINCIDEIVSYSTNRLKLKIGKIEQIVSRDKVSDFKQWMDR
jgi:DNA-binding LytR/AlgR family response regulator